MATIILGPRVLDYASVVLTDNGDVSNCTSPAGHCFGSDGGTGIPPELKVSLGRGGKSEIWKLNLQKSKILNKYRAEACQYCLKYNVTEEIPL